MTTPDTASCTRGLEGLDFIVSPRVARGALGGAYQRVRGDPVSRPLRIFALDPSMSRRDGAVAVVHVPYEPLRPGPAGALLDVVDEGSAGTTATRLDLDDPGILLDQGRPPSATDPLFRAQMVYAVCSTTYAAFRRALGRDVPWGFDQGTTGDAVRLRVRSCVDASRNAFYDGTRGELRFGAYAADDVVIGNNAPRGRVCTALSHDVVVHETAHAMLDGLRAKFLFPSNADVLAFHEAFADLVAIFQRFTYREVVRAAIVAARGGLSEQRGLLTAIGQQFARTASLGDALRTAVPGTERRYGDSEEPHRRGEVLLAAVFGAFLRVYDRRALPLVRLASEGAGVLPPGHIPDLLADALTDVARKVAQQFLTIVIRAIDYCPPVDITFGEYLRAAITADADMMPGDPWNYREAWIDAFRGYGIYPADVPALTEDALLWVGPDTDVPRVAGLGFDSLRFAGDPGRPASEGELRRQARALGELVGDPEYRRCFGLAGTGEPELHGDTVDIPIVESVRSSRRTGPAGQVVFDTVAEVTQRRLARHDGVRFDYYGGATVILDAHGEVRYVIRKSVLQQARLERQREFLRGSGTAFWSATSDGHLLVKPQGLRLVHEAKRLPGP